MNIDNFESVSSYLAFLNKIKELTDNIRSEYPDEINCIEGCCDCCNNVFIINISIIEGFYLQNGFKQLDNEKQAYIKDKILKIKKHIEQNPDNKERLECPLLIENRCALYNYRPVICRTFGYPMIEEKSGKITTCRFNFLSMRDNQYTVKSISTKVLSANIVLLSQYLLKELGKDIPENYIPSSLFHYRDFVE